MAVGLIKLTDELTLFLCCTLAYLMQPEYGRDVVVLLIPVIFASLLNCIENEKVVIILTVGFFVWNVFLPPLAFFLPTIFYRILFCRCWPVCFFAFVPLLFFFHSALPEADAFACVLLVLGALLTYRTNAIEKGKAERNSLQDSARELSIQLEHQNKELLEHRDSEINVATLNERNRIAREIHDSVGHLLSSSILQVGALLAVNRDESTRSALTALKGTLNEAMNSIRISVHDLYDESVDLYEQLYKITKDFAFCKLDFQYELDTEPGRKLKFALLAIVKEGLSNIIRHSNATRAEVSLREHPAFYQLIISDNGIVENYNPDNGIGLRNIRERVESFHGVVNITAGKGFRIFISVPKGEENL